MSSRVSRIMPSSAAFPARRSSRQVPGLEEVVVLALAASRLARAVSVDEITAPARGRVSQWASRCGHRGLPRWLDRLICCPLCTGWWFSMAVSLLAPGRQRVLRGVSVAGAQVMLSLAERLVSEEGRAAIQEADLLHEAVAAPDGEPAPDGDEAPAHEATTPRVSTPAGVGNGG
jgi:hypothetical protein